MVAILKREYNAYFKSILGYVFLTFFLIITGALFFLNNLNYGDANMNYYFSWLVPSSIIILPILTMRLFAEERKQKTDQLLLTAPVSLFSIVMGKFLAALLMLTFSFLITLIYPIILSFYGSVSWAEIVSAYIGYILYASTILAIGCFMSSITENQIIAAVSTYGILIFMMIISSMIGGAIKTPILVKIFSFLTPMAKFNDFTSGILNVAPILYYLSATAIFVFATISALEHRRWN